MAEDAFGGIFERDKQGIFVGDETGHAHRAAPIKWLE